MLQSESILENISIHLLLLQKLQKRAFSAWRTLSSQQEARASNLFAKASRRRSQKQVFNTWASFTVLTAEVVRNPTKVHLNHAIVLDGKFPLAKHSPVNYAIVLDKYVEILLCSTLSLGKVDQGEKLYIPQQSCSRGA